MVVTGKLISVTYNTQQEVGGNLSTCMLNPLYIVSTLPILENINLIKVEIIIFQIAKWPHFGLVIKGSCRFKSWSLSQ